MDADRDAEMDGTAYELVIGDRNWSSWSLRPWLAMKVFGIPFIERPIRLRQPGTRAEILRHSPAGQVPILKCGDGETVWESLAILETLAERHPGLGWWPEDAVARARARAVSAEMHAGFGPLRRDMPMAFIEVTPLETIAGETARDVARIVDIWTQCRRDFGGGGPFLFGRFSIADAMYAPVASRFVTYGVDLAAHGDDGPAAVYRDTIMGLRECAEWRDGAAREVAQRA